MAVAVGPDLIGVDDLAALLQRPQWHKDAACAEHPDVDFFPGRGASQRAAKAICLGCLVRADCRTFSFANDEHYGVWGGASERERIAMRHLDPELIAQHRVVVPPARAACGTHAAYERHRVHGELPCEECDQAKAERRARKRPRCGTMAGYEAHRRRGEQVCSACRDARARHRRSAA